MNTWSNKNRRKYLKHNNPTLRLGKRRNHQIHGGWVSKRVQPSGKYWKRYFGKKSQKSKLYDGLYHKKVCGWLEWS